MSVPGDRAHLSLPARASTSLLSGPLLLVSPGPPVPVFREVALNSDVFSLLVGQFRSPSPSYPSPHAVNFDNEDPPTTPTRLRTPMVIHLRCGLLFRIHNRHR